MKKNKVPWRLRLKETALRGLARLIPVYPLQRAALKAHYINWETANLEALEQFARELQFDPTDAYNGHPFHWSHRDHHRGHEELDDLEWLRAANEKLAANDAAEAHPDWEFSTILAENLRQGR